MHLLPPMTMRVMQVLHQGGGAGSVTSTLHLSLALQRAGVEVGFVCPPDSEVEALARAGGLLVHPVALRPGAPQANGTALAELLRRQPVDLINSQSARDRRALSWLGLCGRLPAPLVITRRQMPRTFFLENWLASRAARRVVAVSHAVAEALRRRGTPPWKLAVIPNGLVPERVDAPALPSEVDAWRERIGWEPTRRIIGIVARPKDQGVVLQALALLEAPVRLVLAGVDPASALAEAARRVPQRHAVVCLPFAADVRPLYELLELVLLPSRIEGLSQSLLEAMALGKPVIASAAGGNPELVQSERNGLLVAPLDPAAWAAAVARLLTDSALARRLGAAARRPAREDFSLDRTVELTLGLYRAVTGHLPLAPSPRPR